MGQNEPRYQFREPGSPAGSHPHLPWYICVFHDPYERVNFWSHFIPGIGFLIFGAAAHAGQVLGGAAMSTFCAAAATTHLCSAVTHVYPDSHFLEKLDHIGIVALIIGTPFTALRAKNPEDGMTVMVLVTLALLGVAFMKPLWRTLSFIGLGGVLCFRYQAIVNVNLMLQVMLYLFGAAHFVRNGGHERLVGLSDHHLLHYYVTLGCLMHLQYIRNAVTHQIHS